MSGLLLQGWKHMIKIKVNFRNNFDENLSDLQVHKWVAALQNFHSIAYVLFIITSVYED